MPKTVEQRALHNMIHSCLNPKHPGYQYAGAKGARVHDAWRMKDGGYEAFLSDVGLKPSPDLVLRRINALLDFIPGNVAWLPKRGQERRGESIRQIYRIYYTWKGETRCLSEWAAHLGLNESTLHGRWKRGVRGDRLFSETSLKRGMRNTDYNKDVVYRL